MIITSVYKGTQEILKGYKGSDLLFDNTTSEPVAEYVAAGLTASFSGYDGYIDGSWVDRVSGYKFTPVSTSTAPVYDETNKLYEATQFGGMRANFSTGTTFSMEFVFRDVKNMQKASSSNYATLVGSNMSGYNQTNGVYITKRPSAEEMAVGIRNGTSSPSYVYYPFTNFVDNGLDTISIVPGLGFFHNGVKIGDCGTSITSGNIGLFTHYDQTNAGAYKAKGKIHAVRHYNRALTAEEVLHNYNADISIYG